MMGREKYLGRMIEWGEGEKRSSWASFLEYEGNQEYAGEEEEWEGKHAGAGQGL